jgi:hypothetical protein
MRAELCDGNFVPIKNLLIFKIMEQYNRTPFKPALMQRSVLFILALFLSYHLSAQAPGGLNYQAVVRNASGAIMPNTHVNMRLSVRESSTTGNIAYQETDTATTGPTGIFTVVIGAGNIAFGNFNTLNWALGKKFLQVEIDVTGGTNFVDMGTSQLLSVPYALFANTAGALTLWDDSLPPVTGNDTLHVDPSTPYLEVSSVVPPSSASVVLTNGTVPGQCIAILGTSMGTTNGVQFVTQANLNVGGSGPVSLKHGDMIMLMWTGAQWVRMAYSNNQ